MIALSWRQFRAQGLVAAIGLAVVGLVLAITGPHLVHLAQACQASGGTPDCIGSVNEADKPLQIAAEALMLVGPVLVGMFWGAPLIAREIEGGTLRLAWTQSVTRNRWLADKLLFGALTTAAAVGLLTWAVNWWASPILATTSNRFDPSLFGIQGVVPVGYGVFAFAVGAGTGLLFRRTVPAMATTIGAFVAARLAVTYWVRPYFAAPIHKDFPLGAGSDIGFALGPNGARLVAGAPPVPNAWVLSSHLADNAGHGPTAAWLQAHCPNLPGVNGQPVPVPGPGGPGVKTAVPTPFGIKDAFNQCVDVASRTYHVAVTYQPGSRFWPFQFAELGLFVVAAVLIGAGCFWWVRHRLV